MTRYERAFSLEAGKIDLESGEFSMVMATEGEASDGHILSIAGLTFPPEMPLQLDHGRSALSNLGVVRDIRKGTVDGIPAARGVGRIRLTGDGEALKARRDLADAIYRGDLSGVSLTWESDKAIERRELPKSHPAHVSRSEPDARKRFGMYFAKAQAIEQSLVAVPADRNALIGRSEAADDDISRAVWQTLVKRLDDAPRSRETEIIEALELQVAALEERITQRDAARASEDLPTELPPLDAYFRDLSREILEGGQRSRDDIRDSLHDVLVQLTGRSPNE